MHAQKYTCPNIQTLQTSMNNAKKEEKKETEIKKYI